MGETKIQEDINKASVYKLKRYVWEFTNHVKVNGLLTQERFEKIHVDLTDLTHIVMHSKRQKNTEILPRAADLTRLLEAGRLTSCKSAKDRTSMSVTWEQGRILSQRHALPDRRVTKVTNEMRTTGVRRENVFKNIGTCCAGVVGWVPGSERMGWDVTGTTLVVVGCG
jgi:hypothetical protein